MQRVKPGKVNDAATPPDPYQLALRLLTARDLSVSALRQKLLQRKCASDEVENCLVRLQKERFLDDRRYAGQIVEYALASGRYVGYRLRQELKRRGISPELIAELTADKTEQQKELELATALIRNRYPDYDVQKYDERLRRRIAGFLQRRGFASTTISSILGRQSYLVRD